MDTTRQKDPPQDARRTRPWGEVSLVLGSMGLALAAVASTWSPAAGRCELPPATEVARAVRAAPPVSTGPLDDLRQRAALGNTQAGVMLAGLLLDRAERGGGTEALFEAVLWIDRAWDTTEFLDSRLAARMMETHCAHPQLRHYWLCNMGE